MSKGSGPITFLSSGNLTLKDCEPGDGFKPAAVDGGVVLSAKKKQGGITYMLTATEATVKNARAMSGAWVSMSKPLGENGGVGREEGPSRGGRAFFLFVASIGKKRRRPCACRVYAATLSPWWAWWTHRHRAPNTPV